MSQSEFQLNYDYVHVYYQNGHYQGQLVHVDEHGIGSLAHLKGNLAFVVAEASIVIEIPGKNSFLPALKGSIRDF